MERPRFGVKLPMTATIETGYVAALTGCEGPADVLVRTIDQRANGVQKQPYYALGSRNARGALDELTAW